MIRGKKIIIFDMDGTLIDSVGVWNDVDRRLIARLGGVDVPGTDIQRDRDAALKKFSTAPDPYLEYCRTLDEKYGFGLPLQEIIRRRYEIAQDCLRSSVDYKPGAEKLLKRLKELGLTLVIATTTKKSNMEVYRTANRNIVSKAPLDEFFARIYTREDVGEIKPSPEVHRRIMGEMNARPEDCLIFEDSLVGVEAANNAAIQVAAVYDRYSQEDTEMIRARADYYFDGLEEALSAIEKELAP